MSTTKAAGDRGEAAVAAWLERRDYTILARQWRCRFGELDLVAQDRRGVICFVEVKLRSAGAIGLPRDFVDQRKQARLRLAAEAYLSEHDEDSFARFDVAEVYTDDNGGLRVEYLENAFA